MTWFEWILASGLVIGIFYTCLVKLRVQELGWLIEELEDRVADIEQQKYF